ncbi:hypothetical protein AK812_SmicGene46621, partial [Symbiodinium microadriaticum]
MTGLSSQASFDAFLYLQAATHQSLAVLAANEEDIDALFGIFASFSERETEP